MRVSIFHQGETVFSFLSISPKTFVLKSGHDLTGALVDVKYSFIGTGIFLHYSM
jgi:hypothetical protein